MAEIDKEVEILQATVKRNDSCQIIIDENGLVLCKCDGMFILNKIPFIYEFYIY